VTERRKGRRLRPGGLIAVPTPASPVLGEHWVKGGVDWLAEQGFRVRLTEHANEGHSYVAGPAESRARDLEGAFADPEVDAIIALGGGHTASQVLPYLDYELIAANPKPFVGFSELTVLHSALLERANLVTFYGPMVSAYGVLPDFSRDALLRALTSAEPLGVVDPEGPPAQTIVPGVAEGELVGGTVSLLSTLMGTPWEPDTRGKILLLEDVDEDPVRVDRYLSHLLVAGKLEQCAGILLGQFLRCGPQEERRRPLFAGPTLSVEEIFDYLIAPVGVPTMYGVPIGHDRNVVTVPLGVRVRLDADAGRLEFLEAALRD
jgi:muramoyltetrapeptide carboxypeptidase